MSWGVAKKLNELGAKVVSISGPDGYIYDKDGISGEKVDYMVEMRGSCVTVVKIMPTDSVWNSMPARNRGDV